MGGGVSDALLNISTHLLERALIGKKGSVIEAVPNVKVCSPPAG